MRSTSAASGPSFRARSPEIPHTVGNPGYAVVSCHVEEALDDRIFRRYLRFVARRPGGFRIASLVRAPDPAAGEREDAWAARVRELLPHGPLGQHTHFGGRSQARPLGGEPAERVRHEAQTFRRLGLEPTWFCGGGWYIDEAVATAAAESGYRDCTGTPSRPAYLDATAARLQAAEPAWLRLGEVRLLELPTTHSIGAGLRAGVRGLPPGIVHLYFHDYDLVDRRRRAALLAALALLARRRRPTDLDTLAAEVAEDAPERGFDGAP
jgi:hypothetical protein